MLENIKYKIFNLLAQQQQQGSFIFATEDVYILQRGGLMGWVVFSNFQKVPQKWQKSEFYKLKKLCKMLILREKKNKPKKIRLKPKMIKLKNDQTQKWSNSKMVKLKNYQIPKWSNFVMLVSLHINKIKEVQEKNYQLQKYKTMYSPQYTIILHFKS